MIFINAGIKIKNLIFYGIM